MDASFKESEAGEMRCAAVSLDPEIDTKHTINRDRHCASEIGQRFYSMLLEKPLDSLMTGSSSRVRLYERTNPVEDVYQKRWTAIEFQPCNSGFYSLTTDEIRMWSPNHFQSTGLPHQGAEDAESLRKSHCKGVHRGNGCQIRESEDAWLANVSVNEVFNNDCDEDVQRPLASQCEHVSLRVSGCEGLGKAEIASHFQSVEKNRLVGLQSNFDDETPDTRTKSTMGTMSHDKQWDEQHAQIVKWHDQRNANTCCTQDPTVAHLPTVAGDVTDERLPAGKYYGEKQRPSSSNGHARLRSHTTHKKGEESYWKCPGAAPRHLASNSRDTSPLKTLVDEQGDNQDLTMQLWALRGSSSVLEVPVFLHDGRVHPQPFEKKPAMMAFDIWANKTMSITELAALHVGTWFTVDRSRSKNTERMLKGLTKYLLSPKEAWKTYLPIASKAGKEVNIQRTSFAWDIADRIKSSKSQGLDSNETNDNEIITGRSYQNAVNSSSVSVSEDLRLLGKDHSFVILPLVYLQQKGRGLNKSEERRPSIACPGVVSTESSAQHAGSPKLSQSGKVKIILDRRALSCLAILQQRKQKEKDGQKPLTVALKTTKSNIANCVPLDKHRKCHISTFDSEANIIKVLIEKLNKLNCEGSEQGLLTATKEQEYTSSLISDLKLHIAKIYYTKIASRTPSGGDLSSSSASARCSDVQSDETWEEKVNGPSMKLQSKEANAATTKNVADDGKTGEEAKWPWQKGSDEGEIIPKSSKECLSADEDKQVSRLPILVTTKNELASFKDDVRKANEPMEGISSEILDSMASQSSSLYPQLPEALYLSALGSQAGADYCSSLQDDSKNKNIKVGKESEKEDSVIVCQISPLSVQTIFNEQKTSQVLESTLFAKKIIPLTQESRNCGVRPLLSDKGQIQIEGVAQKSDDLDLSAKTDGSWENSEKLPENLRSVRPNEQTRKVCEPSQGTLDFALPIEAVVTEMSDGGSRFVFNEGHSRENTEKTVPAIGKDKQKSKECKNDADLVLSAEKNIVPAYSVMGTGPAAGQCSRHPPSSDLKMFSENRNHAIMQNSGGYADPDTVNTTDSQQTYKTLQTDIAAEAAARKVIINPTGSLEETIDEVRGQRSASLPDTSSGARGRQEVYFHFLPRVITKRNVGLCLKRWSRAEWRAEMNDDRGVRATNWPLSSRQDGRVSQQLLSKDPRVASLQQQALPKNGAQNACTPVQQVRKSFSPVQQGSVPRGSNIGWIRHPSVASRIEEQARRLSSSHLPLCLPSRYGQPARYQQPSIAQQRSHEKGSAAPKQHIEKQEALPETKGSSTDKVPTRPFSVVDCNLHEIIDNPLTRTSPFTVNLQMSIWSPGYHLLSQARTN